MRKHREGRWRLQIYRGQDPDNGKDIRPSKVIDAPHSRRTCLCSSARSRSSTKPVDDSQRIVCTDEPPSGEPTHRVLNFESREIADDVDVVAPDDVH